MSKRRAETTYDVGPAPKARNTAPDAGEPGLQPTSAASPLVNPAATNDLLLQRLRWYAQRFEKGGATLKLNQQYTKETVGWAEAYNFECVHDPFKEPDEDSEDEEDDDEETGDEAGAARSKGEVCDQGKTCPCERTPEERPGHEYMFTKAGLKRQAGISLMSDFRNPDAFDLYTFNDHFPFGCIELIQNLLVDFDYLWKHGDFRECWTIVETIPMFVLCHGGSAMCMCEDGEMVNDTMGQAARLALTAIHAAETNGWLPRNLPFVIELWLEMLGQGRDMGILEEDPPSTTKVFKMMPQCLDSYLLATAKRLQLRLPITSQETVDAKALQPMTLPDLKKPDPWMWKAGYEKIKKNYGSAMIFKGSKLHVGGDHYDLSAMEPKEREQSAFEKGTDPMPAALISLLSSDERILDRAALGKIMAEEMAKKRERRQAKGPQAKTPRLDDEEDEGSDGSEWSMPGNDEGYDTMALALARNRLEELETGTFVDDTVANQAEAIENAKRGITRITARIAAREAEKTQTM